jgi:branched-chain amino acid transport system substrate-binding protein
MYHHWRRIGAEGEITMKAAQTHKGSGRGEPRRRRGLLTALAGASALIAVAACGSSSKSSSIATTATTAAATSATTGASSAATPTTAGSAPAGATIKLAYLNDQSGSLASTFGGGVIGAQVFVKYSNAHGGLYGHKLSLNIYDDQSSPSAVLSNARLAVGQGAQAIISSDVYFDSAASYLQAQKIPVFGAGITPGFYGPDKTTFFSQEGNWIGYESDAQMKFLVGKGLTKIAVVSDANPGNSVAAHAVAKAVGIAGGKLIYTNYTVDDTSSPALLALAQRLESDGAQAVYTNFYGTAAPQLQADMSQVHSKALVVAGSIGVSPAIPQQFGSTINGLLSEVFSATWYNPTIPAMQTFTSAMKQYSPSNVQNAEALSGWANMLLFAGAIQQLGSNAPTPQNIATAGNTLKNYTGQGMFPPVSFPADHSQLNPCFSLAQIVSGQWKIVTGNATDPFACGVAVSSS